MELDIIGLSETSQREGEDFGLNITMNDYHKPFSLGSKTLKVV